MFEFIDRGTEDETALRNGRAAFDRLRIEPRALAGGPPDLSCRVLGRAQAAPLAIAPTGAAGIVRPEGDLALARAAAAAGIPCAMAARSMTSLERAAEAGGDLWLQVYATGDAAASAPLLERARRAGVRVLVVTVDTPVPPRRDYNARNGFALPFRPSPVALLDMALHPRWLAATLRAAARDGVPRFENMPGRPRITGGAPVSKMLDGTLSWEALAELRRLWPDAFAVKGVLSADDAARAVALGADAVIVSSHGGRNLDVAPAPIDALPRIADRVGGRVELLLDGFVRRGSDIAKALALGASAVLIGRATLYGLAAGGEAGAARALELLIGELAYVCAMSGAPTLADLSKDRILRDGG